MKKGELQINETGTLGYSEIPSIIHIENKNRGTRVFVKMSVKHCVKMFFCYSDYNAVDM